MRAFTVFGVGAAVVGSSSALVPKRALLQAQTFVVDEFSLVDLSEFPAGARGVVDAGETVLGGDLGIEVRANAGPAFGTYSLPPAAALALSDAISALVCSSLPAARSLCGVSCALTTAVSSWHEGGCSCMLHMICTALGASTRHIRSNRFQTYFHIVAVIRAAHCATRVMRVIDDVPM